MSSTKPTLKKVTPCFGNSILMKYHTEAINKENLFWHFHPEVELVYIKNGKGMHHIGNHLAYYNSSQLILLGSNLPHSGCIDRLACCKALEISIQFKPEFLGTSLLETPEMNDIAELLERGRKGIIFNEEAKKTIGPKIEDFTNYQGIDRILKLLEILRDLSRSEDYTLLNADGFAFEAKPQDNTKIDIIFKYVRAHFKDHIGLDDMAKIVSMTVPSFSRYFKKVTGKTFIKFLNEYRVVHAIELLSESNMTISDVSFESGFNNFSHFNKQFNEFTGKSALVYRNGIKKIIQ